MKKQNPLPKHIAFIMDGNGRWAQARNLPRVEGHRQGSETVRILIDKAIEMGIEHLTFYAFSTENWKRSTEEVSALMGLARMYFRNESASLAKKNVRVRILGDLSENGALPTDMRKILMQIQEETMTCTGVVVHFAINYGGRDEIVRAVRSFAEKGGNIRDIKESDISDCLDTAASPDPELMIRTAGDSRVSNFLLWQLAYAELMFVHKTWPDFSGDDLQALVEEYQGVSRRFGGRIEKDSTK